MKKLALILTFIIGALIFSSCHKEDPAPDCLRYGFGKVTVENLTGWDLFVDVTWGNIEEYDTRLLYHGKSTTYHEIPAGTIDIWGSYDEYEWSWSTETLTPCEDMIFTWYSGDKKSTEKTLMLKVKKGDKEIILKPEKRIRQP